VQQAAQRPLAESVLVCGTKDKQSKSNMAKSCEVGHGSALTGYFSFVFIVRLAKLLAKVQMEVRCVRQKLFNVHYSCLKCLFTTRAVNSWLSLRYFLQSDK
jgi:hypothetical protein